VTFKNDTEERCRPIWSTIRLTFVSLLSFSPLDFRHYCLFVRNMIFVMKSCRCQTERATILIQFNYLIVLQDSVLGILTLVPDSILRRVMNVFIDKIIDGRKHELEKTKRNWTFDTPMWPRVTFVGFVDIVQRRFIESQWCRCNTTIALIIVITIVSVVISTIFLMII